MPAISLQEQGEPPLEPQVEQQEDLNDDELLEEDLEEEEEELGQEDFEEELDELAEDLEDREGADGHREERRLLQERLKQAQQELEHFRQQEQQEMLDAGEVEASRAFLCLFLPFKCSYRSVSWLPFPGAWVRAIDVTQNTSYSLRWWECCLSLVSCPVAW